MDMPSIVVGETAVNEVPQNIAEVQRGREARDLPAFLVTVGNSAC